MDIKKNTFQNIVIVISGILLVIILFALLNKNNVTVESANPVSYSGDSQIIELTAKGGYTPNAITAKAGVNTILNVITNKTFDCSSSIRISKLNVNKNLPLTGTTQIPLGIYNVGDVLDGTCSMGMYSFKINFV